MSAGDRTKDLMSPGAECIQAHETLDRAAQMMRDMNVGALPVCGSDDRLKGIITDRDIVVKCVADGHGPVEGDRRANWPAAWSGYRPTPPSRRRWPRWRSTRSGGCR